MNITEKAKEINSNITERVGELWAENPSHIVVPVIIVICSILSFMLGRLSAQGEIKQNSKDSQYENVTANDSIFLPADTANKDAIETQGSLASAVASTRGSVLADPNTPAKNIIPKDVRFVASKRGKTYYFAWCAGAKSILEINKRYFDTAEQARSAGLKPSKSCKGLK